MKIGILTYHRSHNYGALLQAVALRKVLCNMGHDVTYIDYWPAYHRHMYNLVNWSLLKKLRLRNKLGYLKNCIKYYRSKKKRISHFQNFINMYINPYVSSLDESYDVIIHGSDQIWRKQPEIDTYNRVYFGYHNIQTKCKVSYAASMGVIPDKKEELELLQNYLPLISVISVREEGLLQLVKKLGNKNTRLDVDPTLLLTGKEWADFMNIKTSRTEKYILYYSLLRESFLEDEIRKYADERRLKLLTIYGCASGKDSYDKVYTADPMKFLKLVYNAEEVFTSSYHGLVFSILFHKPFFAAFHNNSSRASSLLERLGLSERLLEPMVSIPYFVHEINFCKVDQKLQTLRKESMSYLSSLMV